MSVHVCPAVPELQLSDLGTRLDPGFGLVEVSVGDWSHVWFGDCTLADVERVLAGRRRRGARLRIHGPLASDVFERRARGAGARRVYWVHILREDGFA
jgi:hypothetical protein